MEKASKVYVQEGLQDTREKAPDERGRAKHRISARVNTILLYIAVRYHIAIKIWLG